MSQLTQYIGLTQSAINFLNNYQQTKDGVSCIWDMFDEKVPLREWVTLNGVGKFLYIKEMLQDNPLPGGPLFTYLYGFFHNDPKYRNPIPIFQWVVDPCIQNKFDREKGAYWIYWI